MTRPSAESPTCICGHVYSSHRLDPNDPYISERCKTCGCAGFENKDEAAMQGDDDYMPNMAAGHEHWDER